MGGIFAAETQALHKSEIRTTESVSTNGRNSWV